MFLLGCRQPLTYLNIESTSVCTKTVAFGTWSMKLEVINFQRLQSHRRAFWVKGKETQTWSCDYHTNGLAAAWICLDLDKILQQPRAGLYTVLWGWLKKMQRKQDKSCKTCLSGPTERTPPQTTSRGQQQRATTHHSLRSAPVYTRHILML